MYGHCLSDFVLPDKSQKEPSEDNSKRRKGQVSRAIYSSHPSTIVKVSVRRLLRTAQKVFLTCSYCFSVQDSDIPPLNVLLHPYFSNKNIHSVPSSPEASSALRGLLPKLYYHDLSETGLVSFTVVPSSEETSGDEKSGSLGSAPVASLPFYPSR